VQWACHALLARRGLCSAGTRLAAKRARLCAQPPALDDVNFPVLASPSKAPAAAGGAPSGAANGGATGAPDGLANGAAAVNGHAKRAGPLGPAGERAAESSDAGSASSGSGSGSSGSGGSPAPATPTRAGPDASLAAAAAAAGILTGARAGPPFPDFAGALRSTAAAAADASPYASAPGVGAAAPPGLKRAPVAGIGAPRPRGAGVGAPRPAANGHSPAAHGEPAEGRGQGAGGGVAWVATGDAVAAEYADARADARDLMRLRNQCFMQARGPPAVAQQLAGRA